MEDKARKRFSFPTFIANLMCIIYNLFWLMKKNRVIFLLFTDFDSGKRVYHKFHLIIKYINTKTYAWLFIQMIKVASGLSPPQSFDLPLNTKMAHNLVINCAVYHLVKYSNLFILTLSTKCPVSLDLVQQS